MKIIWEYLKYKMENMKWIKIYRYIFDCVKCNKGSIKFQMTKDTKLKSNDFESQKAITQAHEAFA